MKLYDNVLYVALALAATLVIELVGMAVATAGSQTWFLRDVASVSLVLGAHHEMIKTTGHGDTHAVVGETPIVWNSDEPAQVDVGFGTGAWQVTLDFTDLADGGYLDPWETITIEIGSLSPAGVFAPAMDASMSGHSGGFVATLTPLSAFTVPAEHYLALRLVMDVMDVPPFVHVDVFDGTPDSPSFITSPATDPGFPVFELPTILLMSGGLLALVGYVVYDRRRRQQHLCRA